MGVGVADVPPPMGDIRQTYLGRFLASGFFKFGYQYISKI